MGGQEEATLHSQWCQGGSSHFIYPEVAYNHYNYRDMIDNHNSNRMHPISMEETWIVTW